MDNYDLSNLFEINNVDLPPAGYMQAQQPGFDLAAYDPAAAQAAQAFEEEPLQRSYFNEAFDSIMYARGDMGFMPADDEDEAPSVNMNADANETMGELPDWDALFPDRVAAPEPVVGGQDVVTEDVVANQGAPSQQVAVANEDPVVTQPAGHQDNVDAQEPETQDQGVAPEGVVVSRDAPPSGGNGSAEGMAVDQDAGQEESVEARGPPRKGLEVAPEAIVVDRAGSPDVKMNAPKVDAVPVVANAGKASSKAESREASGGASRKRATTQEQPCKIQKARRLAKGKAKVNEFTSRIPPSRKLRTLLPHPPVPISPPRTIQRNVFRGYGKLQRHSQGPAAGALPIAASSPVGGQQMMTGRVQVAPQANGGMGTVMSGMQPATGMPMQGVPFMNNVPRPELLPQHQQQQLQSTQMQQYQQTMLRQQERQRQASRVREPDFQAQQLQRQRQRQQLQQRQLQQAQLPPQQLAQQQLPPQQLNQQHLSPQQLQQRQLQQAQLPPQQLAQQQLPPQQLNQQHLSPQQLQQQQLLLQQHWQQHAPFLPFGAQQLPTQNPWEQELPPQNLWVQNMPPQQLWDQQMPLQQLWDQQMPPQQLGEQQLPPQQLQQQDFQLFPFPPELLDLE